MSSQISLSQQRGLVVVEFVWHHSIARPRKPPIGRKHLRDISYTSRVIADFVPNFVAIATGVGRGRIWLATFNSPPPKTPCYTQRSRGYLLYKPSYSRFCPKFRCHGNGVHLGVNLDDAVKQAVPENPTLEPKIMTILCTTGVMIVLNFFKFPHRRHYKFFDLGGKIGEGITGF